jgi:hypothetical protein
VFKNQLVGFFREGEVAVAAIDRAILVSVHKSIKPVTFFPDLSVTG